MILFLTDDRVLTSSSSNVPPSSREDARPGGYQPVVSGHQYQHSAFPGYKHSPDQYNPGFTQSYDTGYQQSYQQGYQSRYSGAEYQNNGFTSGYHHHHPGSSYPYTPQHNNHYHLQYPAAGMLCFECEGKTSLVALKSGFKL